jgi:hypothetical protein
MSDRRCWFRILGTAGEVLLLAVMFAVIVVGLWIGPVERDHLTDHVSDELHVLRRRKTA